jgi:hypothetical protein
MLYAEARTAPMLPPALPPPPVLEPLEGAETDPLPPPPMLPPMLLAGATPPVPPLLPGLLAPAAE